MEDPAFQGSGTILDNLRDRTFTASGPGGFPSGRFSFGTLVWNTGPKPVSSSSGGTRSDSNSLPLTVVADTAYSRA